MNNMNNMNNSNYDYIKTEIALDCRLELELELANDVNKQQILYAEFLAYVWKNEKSKYYNDRNQRYYSIFFMLSEGGFFLNDASNLIKWIEEEGNGKLPENIQILFNEWILEKKL